MPLNATLIEVWQHGSFCCTLCGIFCCWRSPQGKLGSSWWNSEWASSVAGTSSSHSMHVGPAQEGDFNLACATERFLSFQTLTHLPHHLPILSPSPHPTSFCPPPMPSLPIPAVLSISTSTHGKAPLHPTVRQMLVLLQSAFQQHSGSLHWQNLCFFQRYC